MSTNHGARQQKKLAKQKAKRTAKRSELVRRTSSDPTVRLQRAEKWPIVQALAGTKLWVDGLGYLLIARQESEGRWLFAAYLVDVYCLGVKNTLWSAGTPGDFKDLVRKMETTQTMRPIDPACLAKIVKGAVEYAQSFGFSPHPDYRHAGMLLAGIDIGTCAQEFTFGRDGKPVYMQGPNESPAQAMAIMHRIGEADGQFVVHLGSGGSGALARLEDALETDAIEEDDDDPDQFV